MVGKVVNTKELKLDYPCNWQYKVIVDAGTNVKQVVKDILDERDFSMKASKNSKKGKYESYSMNVLVHSDDDRKTIFETLKKDTQIKFVL